jgi:predicted RNase H-like HicB family nuclease
MIREYIDKALEHAHYEIIDDEEPFYGEIPALPGVWATGKTLEVCRNNLSSTVEGWLLVRIHHQMPIQKAISRAQTTVL